MRTIRGPHHTALHRLPHGWPTSKGRGLAPHNKDLFKILIIVMVAGVAGIAKLYLDGNTHVLFYAGIILLLVLVACSIIVTGKIELHLTELSEL